MAAPPPRKYPGHKNPAIFAGYGHIGVACFGRSDRGDGSKRCEQEKQPGEGRGLSERLEQANIDGIGL